MAKATLAPGEPLACLYDIDGVSSFRGSHSSLPSKFPFSSKEPQ
jgi:hypothetical protein